jgi:hypothetical protein
MDWLIPTARVNEHWREGRILLDRSLGPGATTSYRRMMEDKVRLFLGQLIEAPEDFLGHIGLSVWRIHFVCITADTLTFEQFPRKTYHVPHVWV